MKLVDTEKVVGNQRIELTSITKEKETLIEHNSQLSKENEKFEQLLQSLQKKFDSLQIEKDQLFHSDQEKYCKRIIL